MAEQEKESRSTNLVTAIPQYLREVRGEINKVTWPTREHALRLTGAVLAFMVMMTLILSSFDFLFSELLKTVINALLGL